MNYNKKIKKAEFDKYATSLQNEIGELKHMVGDLQVEVKSLKAQMHNVHDVILVEHGKEI